MLYRDNRWVPETPQDRAAYIEQREQRKRAGQRIDRHVVLVVVGKGQPMLMCRHCDGQAEVVLPIAARDLSVLSSEFAVMHTFCVPADLPDAS